MIVEGIDAAASDEATYRRLKWRCRRGMRELDQMTERYLETRYRQAPTEERGQFLQLLTSEDDKLFQWLMGYEQCERPELLAIIDIVRSLPADVRA